jgi:hypothetical protein
VVKLILVKNYQKNLIFHIDLIWFKPGGYSKDHQRTASDRESVTKDIMLNKSYIIEGASGITSKKFAKVATHLVFIKYPKDVCLNSIRHRHLDKGQNSSKAETDWLYNFAKTYYSKTNKGRYQNIPEIKDLGLFS